MNLLEEYVRLALDEKIRSVGHRGTLARFSEPFSLKKFKEFDTLRKMLTYANTNLEMLGEGSSRAVYALTGNKVLKIATNRAGVAQNEQEVDVYTDPLTKSITTRIYDSDPDFMWLISEVAREAKWADFSSIGIDFDKFSFFVRAAISGNFEIIELEFDNRPEVMQMAKAIEGVANNNSLLFGDLKKMSSWGKTADGRLVLLDYGYSRDVWMTYY